MNPKETLCHRKTINGWFADFIIGEDQLKKGNRNEANEAFKRSYEAIQQSSQGDGLGVDNWLADKVKARLEELDTVDRPAEGNGNITSENKKP